jgi:7-cyano-7-deazaguanine reductase
MKQNPLGKTSEIPQKYAPDILFGIPRSSARQSYLSGAELPFRGIDIWNAWEMTWLDQRGKPVVGTAEIVVSALSENIIESKSLKLYLNAFANERFASASALAEVIAADLGKIVRSDASTTVFESTSPEHAEIRAFPGTCIDRMWPDFSAGNVDAGLLCCETESVSEELHSHLLRSLCPVTGQPDAGSILVRYSGRRIRHESLLQYLVSYRNHSDFHEACVEQIFVDLKSRCDPDQLSVYARYNRRGGIDINPFRSDIEEGAENLRLWRQ